MKNLEERIYDLKKIIKNENYSDARIKCENLLKKNQAHIELNFLLGFIYSRLNLNNRAEEILQNTIFLDPKYYDALVELSLFYEKIGQNKKASIFRERAFRISNKISN